MTAIAALARGRDAFTRDAWGEAYAQLSEADRDAPLEPEDLDRLATAAFIIGRVESSIDARMRAHQGFVVRGDTKNALRSAFWLLFAMQDRAAYQAQAAGWLARTQRMADDDARDCPEGGLVLCALGFQRVRAGDIAAAESAFEQAAHVAAQFKDADLTALARHGQGRLLLMRGRTAEGFAALDEVMVAVTCGEVCPMIAGTLYCSVISVCHDLFDLRRANEWTSALAGWCASHPAIVPFRAQCLIRRSELLQLHGEWPEALVEAHQARDRCDASADGRDDGAAYYQLAELHRIRGDFQKADEAYRMASQKGRRPHPGLALLRLAQGQIAAADAAIRQTLQENRPLVARAHMLRAAVEIMLASKDLAASRAAAEELARIVNQLDAPFLRGASANAAGAVALAQGDAAGAIALLRDAWTVWRELDAPYEIARVRELTGLAYRTLGDEEGAQLEFEAGLETFDRLGATPDSTRLSTLVPAARHAQGPLTGREVEVLRLVAAGKTNRMIAETLSISEKTVARHVSNIFTKLDLPSRSAATAYAYNHKLI